MGISASGLGTGLDIKSLVDQLVSAERQPAVTRLDTLQAKASSRLSAIGTLKSALSIFRDAVAKLKNVDSLQSRTVTTSEDDIVSVSATSAAAPGTYSVEVLSRASTHKLASGAFASADTVVGTGTLSITVNGKTDTIDITDKNSTLAAIRDAINSSDGNPGVRAALVTADDGVHLLLGSTAAGVDQAIRIDAVEPGSGLEALEFGTGTSNALVEKQAATDAQVKIDGYTVSASGNTLDSAIDGLSIDLLKAAPGTTVDVTVATDNTPVQAAVQKFADAYNGLVDTITKLTSYNASTKTSGALLGDATVRNLQGALRRALATASGGSGNAFGTLADIGIQGSVSGKLTLDASKLGKALNQDIGAVGRLFGSATTGFSDRIGTTLDQLLNTGGSLATSEQTLQSQLKDISSRRDDLDRRMAQVQARYQKQFDAMDTLVQQLNSSGSAFLSALAKL